ncbi:MAG: PhoH-related ATPase [Candidatus Dependentiae bacterium]|nr:PhoH-related ATPase [Candidatus Dependentiae bacterium]
MLHNTLPKVEIAVLDTDVFLKDPYAPLSLHIQNIIVPFQVLEELDDLKRISGAIGRQARQAIHLFEALRLKGDLHQGVRLEDEKTPIITVAPLSFFQDPMVSTDDAVLATARHYQLQGKHTLLYTQDINMRLKAASSGITSREFKATAFSMPNQFASVIHEQIPAKDLKAITQSKIMEVLTHKPTYVNQFIKLMSQNNPENYRIFRYTGGEQFHEIQSKPIMNCFTPKNAEQAMTLDLLMDDSIELVSLIGKAGTGKTFLVLLAGLVKVLHEKTHRRIMVTRPTVSLGPDIGFLPGDVNEKIENWMYPIFDNIGIIGSEIKKAKLPMSISVEDLRKANQLSLQAITYMRGRSLPYQFMFIDEAQNLTPLELKTLITRAGKGTKVIIAGDPEQIDTPHLGYDSNGLVVTTRQFMNEKCFGVVQLHTSERSNLAQKAAELL